MERASLLAVNSERRARRAVILLSDLGGGPDRVLREGEEVGGELRAVVAERFRSGRSGRVEADGREWMLTAYLPSPRIVAIGAVHISQALAPMARLAGYDIEIIDPRTAFATPERFPDVSLHADWPEDRLAARGLDAFTALAALTHDSKIDDLPLLAALRAECFYVGALGSRKTHAKRLERLAANGATPEQVARIKAPIGLPIGAASPAEIAVAVLAEIIAAFRSRGVAVDAA